MRKKDLIKFFGQGREVFLASAPGRLDVMGGIADYSGSLVLQLPIRERTPVALALRDDGIVRVRSEFSRRDSATKECTVPLKDLSCVSYDRARKLLSDIPGGDWAAYAIGCVLVLMKENLVQISGVDILIDPGVPIGKGVSSSAALEVAVMAALAKACKVKLERLELPILAQMAENHVVGAPCGLMDQLATYLGEADRLLPILCQPDRLFPALPIPPRVHFVGIDSGVRHAVSGASYSDVRMAAFMGYTIIARREGTRKKEIKTARRDGDWSRLPYGGYLANIPPSLFETTYRNLLPERITGKAFLEKYGDTIDCVTSIDPRQTYSVRACAAHPVYECFRVSTYASLLKSLSARKMPESDRKECLTALGELMFQSHASYSACGLGNFVTDELTESVRSAGPERGVFGARITGGGCGGTVCVLCHGRKGVETAKTIARVNAKKYQIDPVVFTGSGDGARCTGVQRIPRL